MEIASQAPSTRGPSASFSGVVHAETIWVGNEPFRLNANMVRFTPGSRTAWHSHANGQLLYVTEGVGYVQSHGDEIKLIRQGDSVWTPPGEWHWHGATAESCMSHVALREHSNPAGEVQEVTWGHHVSEEEIAKSLG
ncbi:cupin domain-containing protein [Citricoccus sp. NPDC055426]|uniref:cupin domain-containing protein n=1 Tax=Citricoccus sp. NPDC055426 TaxID=3155536 RepID=UPI0034438965